MPYPMVKIIAKGLFSELFLLLDIWTIATNFSPVLGLRALIF